MNLLEIIKSRKSVRKYLPKEVEAEKLAYIMECARLAPSAVNFQPWHFYIIEDGATTAKLYECYHNKWFSTHPAPLFLVACGDHNMSWKRKHDNKDHLDIDVAIAFEHICLAATEQELGTCWVCNFDPDKVRSLLNLPENMEPVAITPIGYPDMEEAKCTPRKLKEDICTSIETAIFAGGCFWGVEYYMQKQPGVISVESGYIGGSKENPSYEEVKHHTTGHAEAVRVVFDNTKTNYETLARLFFEIHDPTQDDGQGPDIGEQYRSEVFYATPEQKEIAERLIGMLIDKGYRVVTQLTPATTFWTAEDYHQNYYRRKGTTPYCHGYTKRF